MAQDFIRYDLHVQDALRGVVRRVLADVVKDGLPGEHHFYITFRTQHPGVRLSNRMRAEYPDEMTIVLQHQFWDLTVTEHAFEVGLSFKGVPEKLLVPFEALTGFFDRSVDFGLRFESETDILDDDASGDLDDDAEEESAESGQVMQATFPRRIFEVAHEKVDENAQDSDSPEASEQADKSPAPAESSASTEQPQDGEPSGAQVVSLDSFRKKS